MLCMTGPLCSTYCAGAEEPCKHAFRSNTLLTRHLHPQSHLPAWGPWEKGPDMSPGTVGCPQSRGKQKELGSTRPRQLCRKMAIVAEVTFCKQISLQHGQFCVGTRVTRCSLASGALLSPTCNIRVGMRKLVPIHGALPNPYTGPWTT